MSEAALRAALAAFDGLAGLSDDELVDEFWRLLRQAQMTMPPVEFAALARRLMDRATT